jgi:hypothetical protein
MFGRGWATGFNSAEGPFRPLTSSGRRVRRPAMHRHVSQIRDGYLTSHPSSHSSPAATVSHCSAASALFWCAHTWRGACRPEPIRFVRPDPGCHFLLIRRNDRTGELATCSARPDGHLRLFR